MTPATASLATPEKETETMHPIHTNLIAQATRIHAELLVLTTEANRNLLADSEAGHQLRQAAECVAKALASLPAEVVAIES